MLIGYMRLSTDGDRQLMDLQRDALLTAGLDERKIALGAAVTIAPALRQRWPSSRRAIAWWCGSLTV